MIEFVFKRCVDVDDEQSKIVSHDVLTLGSHFKPIKV